VLKNKKLKLKKGKEKEEGKGKGKKGYVRHKHKHGHNQNIDQKKSAKDPIRRTYRLGLYTTLDKLKPSVCGGGGTDITRNVHLLGMLRLHGLAKDWERRERVGGFDDVHASSMEVDLSDKKKQ
jgi:hypothetical protein